MAKTVLDDILKGIERWDTVVRVSITHTLGSTPRKAGADMIVAQDDFRGSIGGGKLEYLAMEKARELLKTETAQSDVWPRLSDNFVLGTELRQCCGGVVWLLFEIFASCHKDALASKRGELEAGTLLMHDLNTSDSLLDTTSNQDVLDHCSLLADALQDMASEGANSSAVLLKDASGKAVWFVEPAVRASVPLVIYGAGHVGRALVRILEGTPFAITWVDINKERFPAKIRKGVELVINPNPEDHAKTVAPGAFHVVMTHSHATDLEICRTLFEAGGARYMGLIASKTKKTKFINRLRKDGLPVSAFDAFHCPIGIGNWSSKEPAVIAISIGAQLVDVYEQGLFYQGHENLTDIRAVGG